VLKMQKEILITSEPQEKRVAVVTDGIMEEFYVERESIRRIAGNIYLGKVVSIARGIGAAFVDIGMEKNGFLYVSDVLGPAEDIDGIQEPNGEVAQKPAKPTTDKIENILSVGQQVMVQVVKETIGTKGPRLTTKVALPGRCLVLTPTQKHFGVSKRIGDAGERARLKELLRGLKVPKDIGLIVRTAGSGRSKRDLVRDMKFLYNLWKKIRARSKRIKQLPILLYQEHDLIFRVIRDSFSEDTGRIIVDSKEVYKKTSHFLRSLMPYAKVKLEFYNHQLPLFEKKGIDSQIEKIYERKISLKGGGYIIIEPTEALVSIDVNTGKHAGKKGVEDTIFAVNMEAAREIPRQIRLRDLGGIIVIDFIDMRLQSYRKKVFRMLEETLRPDRSKTNILRMSDLGLIEMTRQRTGGPLETMAYQQCPYCQGRGSVKSPATMAIAALRQLRQHLKDTRGKKIEIMLHPDVGARLLNEDKRSLSNIERRFRARISIRLEQFLHTEDIRITEVDNVRNR